ncbi:hypothetical protein EDC19_1155 [Natranaerovirga hydrolytica]|uniref:Calcineurin-like phosphoesterase domain-containing protein n=1 Tax=Natranaerovirga hydrolytica TaxID=680378 RepID=A0A4V2Q1R9_9FIRM|nr:metallophosphoesterase [Natranaerovirga hydrolytica]TCK98721.1 hypothetical protein EDC19_1155 [Natranaerovirga hydrolytica]
MKKNKVIRRKLKNYKLSTQLIRFISVIAGFCFWQNNIITTTYVYYDSQKVDELLSGYKIIHISDLHNKSFGRKQKRLIEKIEKQKPNIIVVTGDMIDRTSSNMNGAKNFILEAMEIAPIYYVTGNHEASSKQYKELELFLNQSGVIMLDNEHRIIKYNQKKINIIGLKDIGFINRKKYSQKAIQQKVKNTLNNLKNDDDNMINILLVHRPEMIDLYVETGMDLVFAGHAHGGQIRVPFIGPLYSPSQGFFPPYAQGVVKKRDTTMVVSRGLGNSIFPLRLFNRPEIIVVTL